MATNDTCVETFDLAFRRLVARLSTAPFINRLSDEELSVLSKSKLEASNTYLIFKKWRVQLYIAGQQRTFAEFPNTKEERRNHEPAMRLADIVVGYFWPYRKHIPLAEVAHTLPPESRLNLTQARLIADLRDEKNVVGILAEFLALFKRYGMLNETGVAHSKLKMTAKVASEFKKLEERLATLEQIIELYVEKPHSSTGTPIELRTDWVQKLDAIRPVGASPEFLKFFGYLMEMAHSPLSKLRYARPILRAEELVNKGEHTSPVVDKLWQDQLIWRYCEYLESKKCAVYRIGLNKEQAARDAEKENGGCVNPATPATVHHDDSATVNPKA